MGAFFSLMALGASSSPPPQIPHPLTLHSCTTHLRRPRRRPIYRLVRPKLPPPRPFFLSLTDPPCSLLLELGIFTSHLLFLLRTRRLRRLAKECKTRFDDMPEARKFVFPRPSTNPSPPSSSESSAEFAPKPTDIEKGGVPETAGRRTPEAEEEAEEEVGELDADVEGKRAEAGMERQKTERRRSSGAGVGRWPSRS